MISVIGMGPGDERLISVAAQQLIESADILVGWRRLLSQFEHHPAQKYQMGVDIDATLQWLREQNQSHDKHTPNIVVLASGDPMLFGIGKRIAEAFAPEERQIVPGISSVQTLFSAVGIDMNDVYITSSHGKQPNFDFIFLHDKVALVTDKKIGPYQIAQQLIQRGLHRTLIIGENLGYPQQQISVLAPEQVQAEYEMNVVVILNERQ
ncbi:cobalt-precorrin-7 (C(5))-methyltransferase [Vibrio nitrifigilis]|uniref:Cobalt-precorrin-7 (C(5))-methyltransferase n=1 Tax=Vibrio nitrifigilis TaxID=2789781 RepID=A0ABS0GJH0_9VIBR|nr:cobalt-precorrin-7 (C(5))-methyltransferase [Vibrio nitrifigilis]MBF9002591.1 cobalt-precorrin-7 (C(5))-methyltransferase [Vibrio nitrifigilis]